MRTRRENAEWILITDLTEHKKTRHIELGLTWLILYEGGGGGGGRVGGLQSDRKVTPASAASAEPLPHEVVRRGLAAVAPHKRAQVVVEGWGLPHERTAARVQR